MHMNAHVVVVTAALGAERRFVVEFVFEIVLTEVFEGCADFGVFQLFLWEQPVFVRKAFGARATSGCTK